jgi:GAF domain-containing protein
LGADSNPLGVILEQAVKLFHADHGNIGLLAGGVEEVIYSSEWDHGKLTKEDDIAPDQKSIRFGVGITGHVAETLKPYYASDLEHDPFYTTWYPSTRSELAAPLITSQGRALGVINLESDTPNAFNEEDANLCMRLARMAAISIEKSQLLRSTEQLHQQIENLEQIPGIPDLEGALTRVVTGVVEMMGKEICSSCIYLYDEEEKHFLISTAAAGNLKDQLILVPPRDVGGVGHFVITNKQAVYYEDARKPHPSGSPGANKNAIDFGVRSLAAFPLLRGKRRLGVLFIHMTAPTSFPDNLCRLLELYAHQAAIAIDDAQRFWMEDALQRIQSASASVPFKDFLGQVVREAVKLLEVEYGELWLGQPNGSLLMAACQKPDNVMIPEEKKTIPRGTSSFNMMVFQTKKPHITHRVDEVIDAFLTIYPKAQSALTIPLVYQGDVIGTLNLESSVPNYFTEQHHFRLDQFAIPAAIAVHNANLIHQTKTLQNIVQELNKVNDLQQTIKLVLEKLREIVDYDNASIQVIHGDQREVYGTLPTSAQNQEVDAILHRRISDDRLIQRIVRPMQPLVLPNVEDEEYWEVTPATKDVHSWMGIPLVVNSQVIGILTIDHRIPGYYTEKNPEYVVAFADAAAAAIFRSKQEQAIRQINELSNQLLQNQDVDNLLQMIADKALKVLDADIIQLYEYLSDQNDFRSQPFATGELLFKDPIRKFTQNDDVVHKFINLDAPLYLTDALEKWELTEPFRSDRLGLTKKRFVVREKIVSNAIVPLFSREEKVGLLFVNYRYPQIFDAGQKTLVELFASQAAIALAKARLFQSLQQRQEALELLNQAGRQVSASLNQDVVLSTLLDQVKNLLKISAASVWLLDPVTKEATCQQATGKGSENLRGYTLKRGEGFVGYAAEKNESLVVADAVHDERHHNLRDLTGITVRSIASITMCAGKEVIGVLQAADERPGVLNKSHLELLEPLAGFAAAAVMNARRLKFVQELGRYLASDQDLDISEALEKVRETAGRLMDTGNMFIALYDEFKDEVSFGIGYVNGQKIDIKNNPRWRPRRAGNGITEMVIKERASLLIKTEIEVINLYKENGLENYNKSTFKSWVGAPMIVKQRVIGVIAAYSGVEENRYDENDVKVLELIGGQVAVALNNARLAQERIHKIEELNEINDLGVALSNITGRR